jgi:hypothetical protein
MKLAADDMHNSTWAQDAKTRTDLSGGAKLRRIKQSHERRGNEKFPPGRDNGSRVGSGTWLKEAQTTNVPAERRFQRNNVADGKREAVKPQGRSEIGVGAGKSQNAEAG